MTIPSFETIMLPFLKLVQDEQEHQLQETTAILGAQFNLTDDEKAELLPSGQQAIFTNRVGWARTFLRKAGLIDPTRRGYFKITKRGLDVLKNNPLKIDSKYLQQFEEFKTFIHSEAKPAKAKADDTQIKTPQEELENAYQELRNSLADELITRMKESSPELFERLVVNLLVKMGYGGNIKDAGKAVGKAGDEGIDGTIKEDRLGLDIIYIQAKRWEGTVGRPDVQKFAGALQGQRAKKGIFITTSDFSQEAKNYASSIESKIVLIDGHALAQYMIDFNIGVSPVSTFEIKRIDLDYFEQ